MSILRNYRKYLTFIIISILLLVITFTNCTYPAVNTSYRTSMLQNLENAKDFSSFTNSLFCYEVTSDSVTLAYTLNEPETYEIPKLIPDLTSFSSQHKNTETTLYDMLSEKLISFSGDTLTDEELITYELLEKTISLNSQLNQYPYYQELLGSTTGIQANLPVTMGEYPLSDKESVRTYLSLLKQIPDYFDDVIRYEEIKIEKNLSKYKIIYPKTLQTMESLLKGFENGDNSFIQTFNERILKISGFSDFEKKYYKKLNEKYVKKYVVSSYEHLYQYLKDSTKSITKENREGLPDKKTAYGLSSLSGGKEYYSLLVKQSTGSTKSPDELSTQIEGQLSQALGSILNTALENPSLYTYYVNQELPSYYHSPKNILSALSLLIRDQYPLLSKTPVYEVKNVSESLAASLSPAFFMIPAIDNDTNNTIYINPLYTNTQKNNLFTTLAHEGFPGHLYQTLYFNSSNPDPIRQLLNYPGYVEGWATYAEIDSYHYLDYPKGKEKLCELYQADTIVSLSLSSLIDIGVNYKSWTLEDVEKLFEKYGFQSYYAKELYTYVLEAPANYLSYFVGYLEICELKEAYKITANQPYKEINFHKEFLDLGPCDFETARKNIFKTDSSVRGRD